ncbi:hypothetical protein C8Q76DRAFT_719156 [Earliella scabrosa]|nr:hypothetical protein C8Q76DRAFT_719156 [Earliella scabrosa]
MLYQTYSPTLDAAFRCRVLQLAKNSAVSDDTLRTCYNSYLAVLDHPDNAEYHLLINGLVKRLVGGPERVFRGKTKDVFQLMCSAASTLGATGGSRYVCAAVVVHGWAARSLPAKDEGTRKRIGRALHGLANQWLHEMFELTFLSGDDQSSSCASQPSSCPSSTDCAHRCKANAFDVMARDGFTCPVTGQTPSKGGAAPVPVHILKKSVTQSMDDFSNARYIDLLKNFCQCADPTVDVISPRNTLLLEERLQEQFQLAAFAFAPTQVSNRYQIVPTRDSRFFLRMLKNTCNNDGNVTFTDHTRYSGASTRPVELPSAHLLRAHAMFTTVLGGTILQFDEYIFE